MVHFITWHRNGSGGLPASSPGHLLSGHRNKSNTIKAEVELQLKLPEASFSIHDRNTRGQPLGSHRDSCCKGWRRGLMPSSESVCPHFSSVLAVLTSDDTGDRAAHTSLAAGVGPKISGILQLLSPSANKDLSGSTVAYS